MDTLLVSVFSAILLTGIVASSPVVRIVEQLHHTPSSDGSYTFAFSSEDGTFRIERRDGGYVVGKYGFIDSQSGLQQVTGYIAGQDTRFGSKAVLGFRTSDGDDSIPNPFSAISRTTITSPEQRALDYIYQSVDDDQDGQPDAAPIITLFNKTPLSTISSSVINQQPKSSGTHQEEATKCMLIPKDSSVPTLPPVLSEPVPSSIFEPTAVVVISNEKITPVTTDLPAAVDDDQQIPINISQNDVVEDSLLVASRSDNNVLTETILISHPTFTTPELEKAIQQVNEALPLSL